MRLPWVLVVVLSVLLAGYVVNDRLMAWDAAQQNAACRGVDVEAILACWDDHDRWPVNF